MQTESAMRHAVEELDFAALLEESLAESRIERGDIVSGTVLSIDNQGLIVDIGWKQDGIVTRGDIERMGMHTADFQVNTEIDVRRRESERQRWQSDPVGGSSASKRRLGSAPKN